MAARHDASAQAPDTAQQAAIGDCIPDGITVWDTPHWADARPLVSVVIVSRGEDCRALVRDLACAAVGRPVEIIVHDASGRDDRRVRPIWTTAESAPSAVRLSRSTTRADAAAARAQAAGHARADWILFVDPDSALDGPDFLMRYLTALASAPVPSAIAGGLSLRRSRHGPRFTLHRWLSQAEDCAPAHVRAQTPGFSLHSGNVLVHRLALLDVSPDAGFAGTGWQDADWGMRLAAKMPVIHVDNPVSRRRLASAGDLMRGHRRSGASFARLIARHPEATAETLIYKAAFGMRSVRFRGLLAVLAFLAARPPLLPTPLRGRALLLWRGLIHSKALT